MAAKGSQNYGRLVTYPWAGRKPYPARVYAKLACLTYSLAERLRGHDLLIANGRADYLLPLLRSNTPLIYHFQNPILLEDVEWICSRSKGPLRLVSVSNSQRRDLPEDAWTTIHNAVDLDRLPFSDIQPKNGYLAFLGRLTYNKGVDIAIRVAHASGVRLKIAGNISDEAGGREFFEAYVRPQLSSNVEWIGEIGDSEKAEFLGNARALLMPLRWDEPFGIVAAEALACGTPVIASRRGAMLEIIHDGVNGLLIETFEEMVSAVTRVLTVARSACRKDCLDRFSADAMVTRYLEVGFALRAGQSVQPETSIVSPARRERISEVKSILRTVRRNSQTSSPESKVI
jgi:glycosyltransferase involved in cell wall biosynthesis